MWAVSSTLPSPFRRRLLNSTTPPLRPPLLALSAKFPPPPDNPTPHTNTNVKGLGHTLLSAINSTDPKFPDSSSIQRTRKPEPESISGSDVLWALQKAAAVRKEKSRSRQMKDKKNEGLSTEGSDNEKSAADLSVRPLRIKSDWGMRLTALEKRLQELSETTR